MICPYYNVNKFKGRKSSDQIVNKTLLVSNAESIAETCLLFASKAFSFKTRAIALAIDRTLVIFFVVSGKLLFSILFLETYFLIFWKFFTGTMIRDLLDFLSKLFLSNIYCSNIITGLILFTQGVLQSIVYVIYTM